jgi:hypothetical protein
MRLLWSEDFRSGGEVRRKKIATKRRLDFKCIRKSHKGVGKTNAANACETGKRPFQKTKSCAY